MLTSCCEVRKPRICVPKYKLRKYSAGSYALDMVLIRYVLDTVHVGLGILQQQGLATKLRVCKISMFLEKGEDHSEISYFGCALIGLSAPSAACGNKNVRRVVTCRARCDVFGNTPSRFAGITAPAYAVGASLWTNVAAPLPLSLLFRRRARRRPIRHLPRVLRQMLAARRRPRRVQLNRAQTAPTPVGQ